MRENNINNDFLNISKTGADMSSEALESISKSEKNMDKIRGSLMGGAAGDALGYAIEFSSEEEIFAKYGPAGITSYELDHATGKALISDDTQITRRHCEGMRILVKRIEASLAARFFMWGCEFFAKVGLE